MRRKGLKTTAPYELFLNEKQRSAFSRKCLNCTLRNPDKFGMPQCNVFHFFLQSITDRTIRWEAEWVELGKEGPICLLHQPVEPQE